MHDMANVRDAPVIWRLQTHSDLRASSSNHEDNHKGYTFFCFSLRVMSNCLSNMSSWLSIKMLLISWKWVRRLFYCVFTLMMAVVILLQYHFMAVYNLRKVSRSHSLPWPIRGQYLEEVTNQRPVLRRGDQSEAWCLLAIRGQSSTQCYCQSTEWTGGRDHDLIRFI